MATMKLDGFPEELVNLLQDHLDRYLATDGEEGYLFDATSVGGQGMVTTLILRTIGRKSGRELVLPLIFGESGGNLVVVASKGGAPQHPAWFLNLQANPAVDVQIKAEKFKARARVAEGEERAQLWRMMVGLYSPYVDYQKATQREIPVVVLERMREVRSEGGQSSSQL
ncbi:MAG: nitroreductase family deazaflavin-dependent oxidoreductase [Gemmatimonadetes bacterium]|nr:nitroreductase family deazaflavin-dependent oxidoreductase [Gemmatimonadota bacterium]